jgi:hypothetical protein
MAPLACRRRREHDDHAIALRDHSLRGGRRGVEVASRGLRDRKHEVLELHLMQGNALYVVHANGVARDIDWPRCCEHPVGVPLYSGIIVDVDLVHIRRPIGREFVG